MRSLMSLAAWVEHAAETRRRGCFFGDAKRIEVRRQGVGSDAGPHFAFARFPAVRMREPCAGLHLLLPETMPPAQAR